MMIVHVIVHLRAFNQKQKINFVNFSKSLKVDMKFWTETEMDLNRSLQPFRHNYEQASHTIDVVCFNFIHESHYLQFKVDSEKQTFKKLFMTILFLQSRQNNVFLYFILMPDQVFETWPFSKPTYYLLFKTILFMKRIFGKKDC